jgi:hypothetical protein
MTLENKVALEPVLFAGGAGSVGRTAVRWFRARHPSVRVLIGGRNLQAAGKIAEEVGTAEAVAIDLDRPHLDLSDEVGVAAVVMLAPETGLKGMSYAQDLGVPYLNINAAITEIGPELAMFAHRATAAPIVLASHWLAGAATFLALNCRIQSAQRRSRTWSGYMGRPPPHWYSRWGGASGCPATPQKANLNQLMADPLMLPHFPRSILRASMPLLGHRISASTS